MVAKKHVVTIIAGTLVILGCLYSSGLLQKNRYQFSGNGIQVEVQKNYIGWHGDTCIVTITNTSESSWAIMTHSSYMHLVDASGTSLMRPPPEWGVADPKNPGVEDVLLIPPDGKFSYDTRCWAFDRPTLDQPISLKADWPTEINPSLDYYRNSVIDKDVQILDGLVIEGR